MITAQDIREKTFEKSTFGGYAMNEVDDFLDEMADELTASQKELATMRAKMKVLVDKIEEYRNSEEDMHKALVSAQKTARTIEETAQQNADALLADAQAKADAMLAEAQAKVDAVTGNLSHLREAEELRLQQAQTAAGEYIQKATSKLSDTLAFLRKLQDADLVGAIVTPAPDERKAIPAPAEEAPAEEAPTEEPKAPNATGDPDYFKAFEEAVYQDAEAAADDILKDVDDNTSLFND